MIGDNNMMNENMYNITEITIYPDGSNYSRNVVEGDKYISDNFGKIEELRIGEQTEIRGSFVASNIQLLKTIVVKIRRIA